MEINRVGSPDLGSPDPRHTLSAMPQELVDIQFSHERMTKFGRFSAGLGYGRLEDQASEISDSDVSGFVQWSSN
jgi:hypothetical protein